MKKAILAIAAGCLIIGSGMACASSAVLDWSITGKGIVQPVIYPQKKIDLMITLNDRSDTKGVWVDGCLQGKTMLNTIAGADKMYCTVEKSGHRVIISNVDTKKRAYSYGTYEILN